MSPENYYHNKKLNEYAEFASYMINSAGYKFIHITEPKHDYFYYKNKLNDKLELIIVNLN